MGPRLDRRGNRYPTRSVFGVPLLQWGHAWTGVGIMNVVHPITPIPASMGPRLDRRGNTTSLPRLNHGDIASMGPRLDRRGNVRMGAIVPPAVMASMGPRLDRRGNPPPGLPSPRHWMRFNGATPGQAWECAGTVQDGAGTVASMGPRLDRRGNDLRICDCCDGLAASMGPRLDRRGNGLVGPLGRLPRGKLQWGHAWTGVGITSAGVFRCNGRQLQWGHAWTGVGIM